ncbi:MAG: sialate O-acetylesterase [Verrucomicrobiota bacterium]|nr:sialate O-acetylesterase [Verrucomicrobiota bacterium]
MKSFFLLIVFAFGLASAFGGQDAKRMKKEVDGQKLGYWLHVPQAEAPAGGWPMFLFLHGAGERGNNLERVKVHGPPKLIGKVDELKNAVVISPQCPSESWWIARTLMQLLKEVIDEHGKSIDLNRIYVTGLSMGGYGSWDLISKYPGFFAAAAPICGGGDIGRLNLRLGSKIQRSFRIGDLKKAGDIPVWAFHGDKDGVVPQRETEILVDALKDAGNKKVKFTSYPGVGHDSWTRTYANPEFYKWIFSQSKKTGPRIKVFLLAGQSNMEGQAVVDLDHEKYYNGGKGILTRVMEQPENTARYAHLKDSSGNWTVRDDVMVRAVIRDGKKVLNGGLSIGFTGYGDRHHFGPELQIGHRLGDRFEQTVLLIKTAWGGKSLHRDFRPPSAGGKTGEYYRKMLADYREGIARIPEEFPALAGCKPELTGFFWFQGWNDMFDDQARASYEQNLVHLIQDLRRDLQFPGMPVVVGELGNGGQDAGQSMKMIRAAQAAACRRPELGGNVRFVKTTDFARPARESPNVGHGHHWFGNAESYFLVGDALGQAMVELLGAR